jgi:hypothetical protein
MTCGMSREQAEKVLHPKAYGEFWIKPGMTRESWRHDWVACGGMPNGNYANDAPQGSNTAAIQAASKRISQSLGNCMQSEGYEYRYE